jgi:uncharacterized protein
LEIRDPVHGSIQIEQAEIPVLEHRFFQRLRNIKQLGFSEYAFPGATHTRYLHSIGVMHVATKAFDKLFQNETIKDIQRLRQTLRMATLLHDIGHAPLSHSTETVMPSLDQLNISSRYLKHLKKNPSDIQATHEEYTIKSITDSSFTQSFDEIKSQYGIDENAIADLIKGIDHKDGYFIIDNKNYFPVLHQLVSSEMDCDRMDYLLRDSYFCGVSYGHYDLDWIIDNLELCNIDNVIYLGINERAVPSFDDFLLSRFHMFLMIYFHYRSVCLEQMLFKYFNSSNNEYSIPAEIEEYQKHDDHLLMKVLRSSKNEWAKCIVDNKIPKKIFESFGSNYKSTFNDLDALLKRNNINYIKCSSSGRLSKYYTEDRNEKFPLKVVRKQILTKDTLYTDINEATDLFDKFSETHTVHRIHCDIANVSEDIMANIYKILNFKK